MWNTFTPSLVALEDRCVPASFGNPWLDGRHLTLSFAPDGTDIAGAASDLSATLAALGPSAKLDILRAFQTWVVHANLNVGLVADGGQDFSTGGAIQGDARFGDIRIGARPLAGDVLAVTAPFHLFSSGSGNIVLNSDQVHDLYTVFLQEAGHAFGLGNSDDVASAMYEWYQGARNGLSPADIAAIQDLYGAREHDAFEGTNGNGTLATATRYSGALEADLTTTGDVDIYRFSVPLLTLNTRISLKASGLSLVNAKLEILDANGRVVTSATSLDPLNNDLTINTSSLKAGAAYYARVSSARGDVFGVGSYQLEIQPRGLLGGVLDLVDLLSTELGLNDTLALATGLLGAVVSLGNRIDYTTRASISGPNDVDYYRIHAPASPTGEPVNIVAAVWALGNSRVQPRLEVFDANGRLIPTKILTNADGNFVVQVEQVQPDADYYLRISSGNGQTGNYALSADFRSVAVQFDLNSTGSLDATRSQTGATLTVVQSQQFHFTLAATTENVSQDGALEMLVRDEDGKVVFQLLVSDGETRSGDVFLKAGRYSVEVRALSKSGNAAPPMTFHLGAAILTDPVGIGAADTTSVAQGGTNQTSGDTNSNGHGTGSNQGSFWTTWPSEIHCVWF